VLPARTPEERGGSPIGRLDAPHRSPETHASRKLTVRAAAEKEAAVGSCVPGLDRYHGVFEGTRGLLETRFAVTANIECSFDSVAKADEVSLCAGYRAVAPKNYQYQGRNLRGRPPSHGPTMPCWIAK
jgi:hypothetical protein